jgi:hypothetical protein
MPASVPPSNLDGQTTTDRSRKPSRKWKPKGGLRGGSGRDCGAVRDFILTVSGDLMTREFDQIARLLWSLDPDTIRFVDHLPEHDKDSVKRWIFALYGATVHLDGNEKATRTALEKARR